MSRWLLACAALVLPLTAGAQILPADWTIPGVVAGEVTVPSEIWVEGIPTRIRVANSTWKADDLFRHYFVLFQKSRFYIPPEKEQLRVGGSIQLTGMEVGSDVTVTVVLTPMPDKTTKVILGQADFARYRKPGAADDEIPLGPGADKPLRTHAEGLQSVGYGTAAADSALFQHYDRELTKRGFKKVKEGVYDNGKKQFRVTINHSADGKKHVLASEMAVPATDLGTP